MSDGRACPESLTFRPLCCCVLGVFFLVFLAGSSGWGTRVDFFFEVGMEGKNLAGPKPFHAQLCPRYIKADV